MRSLSVAATGMLAQQLNVEVVSNNIANLNTTGFKRQRAEFQDLLYQTLRRPGANSSDSGNIVPTGVQVGVGVKAASVYRIAEQGNLTSTDNPLDIAIQGRGFFRVEIPGGVTAYTRAGSFQMSATGEIVTSEGYRVLPGLIVPPAATAITVNTNGEVSAKLDGQVEPQVVGQIQTATFANEAGLEPLGENLAIETPASGAATLGTPGRPGYGGIRQGFIETSNVNVVSEITNLIAAQRAYEMNSRVIKASDEMMSTLTQMR
jgi:flagellar basal-body rod protein FlgG